MRVTILTRPVRAPPSLRHEYLVKSCQDFVNAMLRRPLAEYSGHPAVTRSLVHGLRAIAADFNFNPKDLREVGEIVHVPSGHLALRQAIRLRRSGRIRRLLAGPNLVVLPSDKPALIGAPEIDLLVTNSSWVRQMYLTEMPRLADHCAIWPAGVDTELWQNHAVSTASRRILIYAKNAPDPLVAECADEARAAGFDVALVRYGRYTPAEYRAALGRARYVVYMSAWESQGLALVEAWSCDVPTLVWNPGYVLLKGKTYRTSAAPYLTERTGRLFHDPTALGELLRSGLRNATFAPRQWVLENMSDEVCARALLALAVGED